MSNKHWKTQGTIHFGVDDQFGAKTVDRLAFDITVYMVGVCPIRTSLCALYVLMCSIYTSDLRANTQNDRADSQQSSKSQYTGTDGSTIYRGLAGVH